MAIAVSPLCKEQAVHNGRRKTSHFLTTLTLKLISKSRGWSEETISSHLVQNQNMENGINQIIKDTKGRIIFKKYPVAKRRRGNHIIRIAAICLTAQKQVLWQSVISVLPGKADTSWYLPHTTHSHYSYLYADIQNSQEKEVGGWKGEGILILIYAGGVMLPKLNSLRISKNYRS